MDTEEIDAKFQIVNMVEKMKNVKQKKNIENYKNIRLLQNIYDTNSNSNSRPNTDVKEGFTDDDYTGLDLVDESRNAANNKNIFVQVIDNWFNTIEKFNHSKAQLIADIFSHKTASSQDVFLIQKYIGIFETIGVSYFVAYNWFFYLFYNIYFDPNDINSNKQHKRPEQQEISESVINEASRHNPIFDLWILFGQYIVKYTELFQLFMLSYVPYFFSVFNYKACFILLFLFFIFILHNLLPIVRNVLIDTFNLNLKNSIVVFMFIILIFFYAPSAWFPAKSDSSDDQENARMKQQIVFTSWHITGLYIISIIIRAIIITLVTLPGGIILLAWYILYFSFFGVFFFYGVNIFEAITTYTNMYIFIRDGRGKKHSEEEIAKFGIIQKFTYVINMFFDVIHQYILYIVYLIMALVAAVDYYNLIDSSSLKTNMLIISFVICIILLSLIIAAFITHTLHPTGSTDTE
jgi:hypothetical protein